MVSRVLGLARDILMAALLGTGPVAQAFLIAFTLPNMFRRFFAEGAFNLAFVPLFAKKVEGGEDAEGFARDALSGLGFVLFLFTIAGQIAMPWLVLAMAGGFAGDERFTLSVDHGRIAFPYILLISLTALLSGVLNSLGRFALPAAAPILMNVVMIAFLVSAGGPAATSASGRSGRCRSPASPSSRWSGGAAPAPGCPSCRAGRG